MSTIEGSTGETTQSSTDAPASRNRNWRYPRLIENELACSSRPWAIIPTSMGTGARPEDDEAYLYNREWIEGPNRRR